MTSVARVAIVLVVVVELFVDVCGEYDRVVATPAQARALLGLG